MQGDGRDLEGGKDHDFDGEHRVDVRDPGGEQRLA